MMPAPPGLAEKRKRTRPPESRFPWPISCEVETMKKDAKELSEQFKAVLEKLQTVYADLEQQINTELAARDARLQELEARITALEGEHDNKI
jgi:uridine kinase